MGPTLTSCLTILVMVLCSLTMVNAQVCSPPCVNGICEFIGGLFRCNCPTEFGGPACEVVESCGGMLTGTSGQLQSPTYGDTGQYYNFADCTWTINVDQGQTIQLVFASFNLEFASSCQFDSVTVYDGLTSEVGIFCGTSIPEPITSTGSVLRVVFMTDYSATRPGFSASFMTIDGIDHCAGDPCMNGASCEDNGDDYTCVCAPGYTGQNCQTDINDCVGVTCQNAGTCMDEVDTYTCVCVVGWSGQNCQINSDDCSTSAEASCLNGGSCVDGVNSYFCDCVDGFTGEFCEVNIFDCFPNPCENGGLCQDGVASYTCTCATGWTGPTCKTDIDQCLVSPCENGGLCIDFDGTFACDCAPGFVGRLCQVNVDECSTSPCQNGGVCTDTIGSFKCECPLGFISTNCESNAGDCATNNCKNGGTCEEGTGFYVCTCAPGFIGMNCEINVDECSTSPCQNGGACRDTIGSYTCECHPGYTGINCVDEAGSDQAVVVFGVTGAVLLIILVFSVGLYIYLVMRRWWTVSAFASVPRPRVLLRANYMPRSSVRSPVFP